MQLNDSIDSCVQRAFDVALHQWEEKPRNLAIVSQVLMREMISVQITDQDSHESRLNRESNDSSRGSSTVKRIRDHIWTKRSKVQKHGGLLPPPLQNERLVVGGVPHFIGRSRCKAQLALHCIVLHLGVLYYSVFQFISF
jgi:hypothetical protein